MGWRDYSVTVLPERPATIDPVFCRRVSIHRLAVDDEVWYEWELEAMGRGMSMGEFIRVAIDEDRKILKDALVAAANKSEPGQG